MRCGLYLPNFGAFGDAQTLAGIAVEAEMAGWDGLFIWDHIARPVRIDVVDPWIALAAIAVATRRIRIGALVTPLARRRPWKVARETVTLDRLSGGRLVFGAGLGSAGGAAVEWSGLGEETDLTRRAAMLDEGLDVLTGLWSGLPFSYEGDFHRVEDACFVPPPLQDPRIPVWIGGYWPARAPLRRAARWDGVFPLFRSERDAARSLRDAVSYVREQRQSDEPFDVIHLAPPTPGDDPGRAAEIVAPFAEAGATWWLERMTPDAFGADWLGSWPVRAMRERIRLGPPARC